MTNSVHAVTLLIPAGAFLSALFAGWFAGRRFRTKSEKQHRAAQTDEGASFPVPGQALFEQIDSLRFCRRSWASQALSIPLVTGAGYLAITLWAPLVITYRGAVVMAVLGGIAEAYVLFRYFCARADYRSNLREYKTKLLTAEALSPFEDRGDFVCHELRLGHLDIDHILVGTKGIFTIQTHPRALVSENPDGCNGTVSYDGRGLYFPKGMDDSELMLALESAELLSAWLSNGLNLPVACRAIISIPGWRVKRTSADGIPVVNPRQFESLFAHISARTLKPEQIQTITGLLKEAYLRNHRQTD